MLWGCRKKITTFFLPAGHTKFALDAGFGIFKSKFRRTEVATVAELAACIEDSTRIPKLNRTVIVVDEKGIINVPTYDWHHKFLYNFKIIPQLKQWHSF